MSGLVISTKTQSGISGGPPGNNTTETDVTYVDASGNGVRWGFIPAYGGRGGVPWYEIAGNVESIPQTSLSTSKADSNAHIYTQVGGVFDASEDATYTLTELSAAAVDAVRAYFDSGTSAQDSNGFTWRARTVILPGDPLLAVIRFDMVNAGSVNMTSPDSSEATMLSGLVQALQGGVIAWQLADSGYGSLGSSPVTPIPSTLSAEPDYLFILPHAGSGLVTGIVSVKQQTISAFYGGTNVSVRNQVNTNRLKVYYQSDHSAALGAATRTWYQLLAYRRNLTSAEAGSIAADYLTPDAGTIVSVGTPAGTFFDLDESCYVLAVASNQGQLTHTITGNVTKRWINAYKLTGYTAAVAPAVTLGGVALAVGTDYVSAVDTGAQVAYVKLLKGIVPSGAVAGELNNAAIAFAPGAVDNHGIFSSAGQGWGGLNAA